MDDAPMLLTEKGKPDTTARHVLQVLAEFANPDGTNARPSVLKIRYRTGYDERTVQRALRRLETAGLIVASGTVNGCTNYRLSLRMKRPASDLADLVAEKERAREAAAERKRRSRSKAVTEPDAATVTHPNDVTVTDAECVTSPVTHSVPGRHAFEVRDVTHSVPGRHALNAPRTTNEPPVEPPVNPHGVGVVPQVQPAQPAVARFAAPIDDDGFELNDAMRRWAIATFGAALDVDYETAQFVDHHRAEGKRRSNWHAEWQKWMRRSAKWQSERATRPLRAVPQRHTPWRNPDSDDAYQSGFFPQAAGAETTPDYTEGFFDR